MERLVGVYRGGVLESFHAGSIAVVDARGRLLAFAGDPHLQTFLRSAAKPFQALPLLQNGGEEEFELASEELALVCASHGGEPKHVSTAAALLRRGEFDESDLQCGTHIPYDDKAAAEVRQSGEPPSTLQNNCSGKHAGMLLSTLLLDAPSEGYETAGHPLQQMILQFLADFAAVDPASIPYAIDGCSVPSFYLSLYRAALAYARFAATAHNAPEPASLPRYADSAKAIFDAMTKHPDYVAGRWSMTTPLMESFSGKLLAKEGAEGFYAMAVLPSISSEFADHLRLESDEPVGIALKINDGSMIRGRNPAILHTLRLLGIDVDSAAPLARYRDLAIRNNRGEAVGELRAEFDLAFL